MPPPLFLRIAAFLGNQSLTFLVFELQAYKHFSDLSKRVIWLNMGLNF